MREKPIVLLDQITEEQWQSFQEQGYVILGRADMEQIGALQQRIDDIMMGTAAIDYDQVMMQLDRSDGPDSTPGPQSRGHKGATLAYRKIQDLELDPLFLEYLQKPLYRDICARAYGEQNDVSCFRAMFMNKPSGLGSYLIWHQDRWTNLDRDPLITVWTALDPATKENGCVQVVPGSHRELLNPEHGSGFLTDEMATQMANRSDTTYLELEAGEVVLLHNWLLHTSDINRSQQSRRAFSVCYMEAATVTNNDATYPVIFGDGALPLA
jgi:phytanoyl-CoA hydroxylase